MPRLFLVLIALLVLMVGLTGAPAAEGLPTPAKPGVPVVTSPAVAGPTVDGLDSMNAAAALCLRGCPAVASARPDAAPRAPGSIDR